MKTERGRLHAFVLLNDIGNEFVHGDGLDQGFGASEARVGENNR